jgi:hypothetical protein
MLVSAEGGKREVMGPFKDVSVALARAGLLARSSGDHHCKCQVVRYLRDDSVEASREIKRSWAPRPFIALRRVEDEGNGAVGLLMTDGMGWLIQWSDGEELEGPMGIVELYQRFEPAALIRRNRYEQEQCSEKQSSQGQEGAKEGA